MSVVDPAGVPLPPLQVLCAVARRTAVPLEEIVGRSRRGSTARARRLAAAFLREQGLTLWEIGHELGGRYASTAHHALEAHRASQAKADYATTEALIRRDLCALRADLADEPVLG